MAVRRLLVVMGVCGCGKTSLGRALAARLESRFMEGDDYHPPYNVAKMSTGLALSNADRRHWILRIVQAVDACGDEQIILACSALNRQVREWLAAIQDREITYLWLKIGRDEAERRVASRPGHFMPTGLVASQFAALEPPEAAIELDAVHPLADLVDTLAQQIA